jgi:hypothetical protein
VTDLDAAIRAKFPVATTATPDLAAPYNGLRETLLAVLDEHPLSQDHNCVKDISAGLWYEDEPCPTLLAIAKGLGIEAGT